MKIFSNFLRGLSVLFLSACNDTFDSYIIMPDPIIEISFTRSLFDNTSLPEGAVVLFNTQGALNIHNQSLTYQDNHWDSDEKILWPSNPDTTIITALYPYYNDLSYQSDNLYTDNLLNDILIAHDTIIGKKNIKLTFKHLFSQLRFDASPSIQDRLQEIRLTTPQSLSEIIVENGELVVNSTSHTASLSKNETGEYIFMIPPMINASLTLDLITDNQHWTHQLPYHTFESNVSYSCNIKQSKGIQNAEDLIIFSKLINGISYNGDKTLDDYREINGNDTIYFLTADIDLTESECNQLLPIGCTIGKEFNSIFDGKNFTISNLIVPDKAINPDIYSLYSGLFGSISSQGRVQNLHIEKAQSVESPLCTYTGILCGKNDGTIINCSVSDATITASNKSYRLGLICGLSNGYIINSHTERSSIVKAQICSIGGIAGHATGWILNCYAYNNHFEVNEDAFTGGIVGQSSTNNPLELSNCCVYHTSTYNYFGSIIGYVTNAVLNNICYNEGNSYFDGKNATISNKHKYDSYYQHNDKHISSYLNEWIQTTGQTKYPDITFKEWSTEGLPILK